MSSEKHPNLQLNKWTPSDYVKMAEFNENFQKIDTKAKEITDAKTDYDGVAHADLPTRLTTDFGKVTSKLADIAINIKDYWVNGYADWTPAINAANTALATTGGTILLSPGDYDYSNQLILADNVSLNCHIGLAKLNPTNDILSAIVLGNNSKLEGIVLKSSATVRGSEDTSVRVYAVNKENITLERVYIFGGRSAGILFRNVKNFNISKCIVQDTKADGIHMTQGCSIGSVENNLCQNTGDDGIACVSYLSNVNRVEDIKITNNTVLNSGARGISNIGSKTIKIKGNTINGTGAAGIIVAYETGYDTYAPLDTLIEGNTISNYARTVSGHAGVLVDYVNDRSAEVNKKGGTTKVIGNTIYSSDTTFLKIGLVVNESNNVKIFENDFIGTFDRYFNITCLSGNRLKNITMKDNTADGVMSGDLEISRVDSLIFADNTLLGVDSAGVGINIHDAKFSKIEGNNIFKSDGSLRIVQIQNLYKSILGYNNFAPSIVNTDTNPYDSGYEWGNKIMEAQGLTLPIVSSVAATDRLGKFGTAVIEGTYPNYKLKVRLAQNDWAYVNLTF